MKIKRRHYIGLVFLGALIGVMLAFGQYRLDQHRIRKIDFIVWYHEHDKDAAIDEETLRGYFAALKSTYDISNGTRNIRYKSIFTDREWILNMNKER